MFHGYLKQSTASQTRTIGPFIDDTDFKTTEDALTINASDIRVKKNGAADVAKNSGGATADVNGMYAVTWDATDTDTVGQLNFSVKVSGALIVAGHYTVLEEAVFDALFAASALGYVANAPVNVAQISGDSAAADALEAWLDDTAGTYNFAGILDRGTAQAAGATSLTLRAGFSAADDVVVGATIWVYSSTNGIHERRTITDWNNTTKVATVDAWTQTPTGTILYVVMPSAPSSATLLPAVNVTHVSGAAQDIAVGTTTIAAIAQVEADTQDLQNRIPAALVSGRIDASVGAMANNVMTAAAAAADLTTELQNGLATAASITSLDGKIDTIDNFIDTEIASLITAVAALDTKLGTSAEPATVPAHNASVNAKLAYVMARLTNISTFNKNTGAWALRNAADSADIATRTDSNDGTTYEKGAES